MSTRGQAVGEVWRREAPHVLAALLRRGASLDDCEDAAQEALVAATSQWPGEGVPTNPRGWLIRVASRRLIDDERSRRARERRELRDAITAGADRPGGWAQHAIDVDDTVPVLLLCAHPALSPASSVALTLRAVCGLTTAQVAAGLQVPESTAAQRISRAKRSLCRAGATFGPVDPGDLGRRLHSVRHVLHLMFTAGSTAQGARLVDVDLTAEAIRLVERLHRATLRDPETTGLLALMLLVDARTPARTRDGLLVPLEDQDRTRWKESAITRAVAMLEEALPHGPVGPFQLQAAIAAVHDTAATFADTDWPQILKLYRMLEQVAPSPAVSLGAAVAVSEVDGPAAGLAALAPLAADRPRDHRVIATQAHLLERTGHPDAAQAYRRAALLSDSVPEQAYLNARARAAASHGPAQGDDR